MNQPTATATALDLFHAYERAQRDLERATTDARLAVAAAAGSPREATALEHLAAARLAAMDARHTLANRLMWMQDEAR